MEQAQIQLQNALRTTFLANLAFLSEYDNDLYHRVDELSRMIEKGTYQEKYILEFIMDNGDFDIYDVVNEKYLYNRNPKKRNDELVRKIELDEKNTINFIEVYFKNKEKMDIKEEDRFECSSGMEFFSLTNNDMLEYSVALSDYLEIKKKSFKKIDKFIFLGTLLGRHIPRIAQKIDADYYLVLERNLEIFRLSLFTVDYTILAKKGVVFSIMDRYLKEEERIQKFIKNSLFENYMIKFSSTGINIDKYIDTLNTSLNLINNSAQYTYTRYLYSFTNRVTKILRNDYKTLIMNEIQEKFSFFENIPILYIAAGPSLDDNIEWIKKYQNKFFIVTIGAAYKKLLLNEIKIDVITTLDEDIMIGDIQFDDESVTKISPNTIILASISTHEEVLKKFIQDNLFLYENTVAIYKNNIKFEGFSIGEITLDILLKMNAKKIYLIGLDLALNQETGETHSLNSSSIVAKHNIHVQQNKEIFSTSDGIVKVKGNFKEEVNTLSMFYNSIKALEEIIFNNNKKIDIYNLSSHGAYFENTIPTNKNDIEINNFIDANYSTTDFLNLLCAYSKKSLDEDTIILLKEDIKELNKIIKQISFEYENVKIENYKDFYQDTVDLFLSLNVNNKLIVVIFRKYLMMVLPYLSYHFNDAKLKQENKKLKKVRNIYLNQIKRILKDYIFCLERVIK